MWNFNLKKGTTFMLSLQAHASPQECHALADTKQTEMAAFRKIVYIDTICKSQSIILNSNHQGARRSMLDSDLN